MRRNPRPRRCKISSWEDKPESAKRETMMVIERKGPVLYDAQENEILLRKKIGFGLGKPK